MTTSLPDLADLIRLAAILDKTKPMPLPSAIYRPETGADWAFIVSTLDAMARMVGPLAQELLSWQQMTVCEEHGPAIYFEGERCPACAEVALLARFDDAYTPEPAPKAIPVALPHQWGLASGCVGYVCRHCGVRRTGQETIMCPSRLEVRR